MANDNCLDGLVCPKCGSFEPFKIEASGYFLVWDEGTDGVPESTDWSDDSSCVCPKCSFFGTVADLRKPLFTTRIYVLGDRDTWDGLAYLADLTPKEMKRIEGGEKVYNVIDRSRLVEIGEKNA